MQPRFSIVILAAAAVMALPATGCSKKPPPSEQLQAAADAAVAKGIPIKLELDETQKSKAEELAGKVKDARFPNDVLREAEHAKLFLYLAATSEQPEVVQASLQGMARAYSHTKAPQRPEVADEDYGAVVAAHLRATDPKTQGFAIEASSHAIAGSQPHGPTVDALVEIATGQGDAPARSMALDMLRRVQNFQQNPKIADAFLAALDRPEPYVVSSALFGLRLRATGLMKRNEFLRKTRALFTHSDAGVRGRAAEVAGRLAAGDEEVATEIEGLLLDENAFTRSAACAALAHLGDLASVHRIMKLVDDTASNKHDIRDYQLPTGRPGIIHHDGSAWSQVRDAAIRSLQRLSARAKVRFNPERVDSKDVEGGLARNSKAAKAWYAKAKAQLPKERKAETPKPAGAPSGAPAQ